MKYKPSIYAKALVEILESKKITASDAMIVKNFLQLLEKNGDSKKANQIIALTENLLLQKTGNKKILLEAARKGSAKDVLKSFIKKGDLVEEKINPTLIAGVKIVVNNNKQLDFSLKNKLEKIFT